MPSVFTTIKGRLILASLITTILTVTAIGVTFIHSYQVRQEFQWQGTRIAPLEENVRTMITTGLDEGARLRQEFLTHTLNAAQKTAVASDPGQFEKALQDSQSRAAGITGVASKLDTVAGLWDRIRPVRERIKTDLANGNDSRALKDLQDETALWSKLDGILQKLAKELKGRRHAGRARIENAMRQGEIWSTTLLLGAMLFGGGFLLLTIISTIKRIGSTRSMMRSVSSGDADLSKRLVVTGRDELDDIAQGFNQFVERIQKVVAEVNESATQVASASEQLSTMSEQMKSNMQNQGMQTEQVAAAVNQMSATAQEVAKNIEETSAITTRAAGSSHKGAELATSAVGGMTTLESELAKFSDMTSNLSRGVLEIGTVVDMITQVAEQTNLLALNAAIEAARAGEQGRGFAVVAEEVRALAQKTQEATGKIGEMVGRLQTSAEDVASAMVVTQERTKSASGEVDLVAENLAEIAGMVRDIADRASQVATAAEEQSAVSEEINRNVATIAKSSEETITGAGQSTVAANDLARLASGLNGLVAQFQGT